MPDDDDEATLVLLRRMDGKLDLLLAGPADPGPQPAVLEPSAGGGGTAGGDGRQSSAQTDSARPDADQSLGMAGATSPDWPFASLQRLVDGQGRVEIALARLLPSGIGRAAKADAPARFQGELVPAVTALQQEAQSLRADVAYLIEVFAIQQRALRRDGDRINALERRVFDGKP